LRLISEFPERTLAPDFLLFLVLEQVAEFDATVPANFAMADIRFSQRGDRQIPEVLSNVVF